MKKNIKRLALLITLVMLVQAIFVGVFTVNASAATLSGNFTGYTKASDVNYVQKSGYIVNWGARGEVATFLTTYAEAFHTGEYDFDTVSKLGGGATTSAAPSSALFVKLYTLMSSKHTNKTSYNATRDLYQYTDCVNSNYSAGISSFYSGNKIGPDWDSGSTWNREHCWPNSKSNSGSGSSTTRENDIMMLRPTSTNENGSRGNNAYGESSGYYNPNSESGGTYDLRGDVARIVLYVYVRWGGDSSNHDGALNYMWGSSGVIESVDVLLKWIEEDPVDTWEMGRNDSVQSITGTRNVFVDYPEYAFLLFGEEVPTDMVTPSSAASLGVEGGTPSTGTGTGSGTTGGDTTTYVEGVDVLDQLYALASGSSKTGNFKVTGKITELDSYNNPTIVIEGQESRPVYCYKLKDDSFAVGQTITVTALQIKNYSGTYELMDCTLVSIGDDNTSGGGNTSGGDNTSGGNTSGGTTGESTTVTFNILTYANANGYNIGDNATKYTNWTLDSNITMTVAGGNNSGKLFADGGMRIYATDSPAGSITIKAANGLTIQTVKFKLATGTYAELQYNGSVVTNGQTVTINANSATFNTVKVGSDGKQVRIAEIEVVYGTGSGSSSGGSDNGGNQGGSTGGDNSGNQGGTTTPTVSITPVKPVVGTAYKLGMAHAGVGKVVYMIGTYEATYYIGSTETKASGLDFYIEETTGGYYIYTTINGAKQYLDMVPSGEHVNAKYVSTPTVVYTWNDTAKTLTGMVNGSEYVFGTRSDKTYTTVGCYQLSGSPVTIQFVATEGGSTPDNPDNPDTPVTPPAGNTNGLADAVKPVVGSDYVLGMNQTVAGKVVYLLGEESGYYLATTVNKDHGLIFNIEETTGGYYIYTMINGAKKYLDMVPSADGAHVNAKYVDTPSTVYTWNETYKTFVGNVGGDEYAFGTRNDKNYETVGCNKLSYEPFVLQFLAVETSQPGGDNPGQPGGDNPGQPGGDNPGQPGGETPTQPGGETPTQPAPSDTKSGCGSAIGGISAVIIALIIPFMFFKKKEDEE